MHNEQKIAFNISAPYLGSSYM